MMKLIAAVDENWGIGYQGNLLQRIPLDMKFFKEKTINKAVIMGRITYESLPNNKPLPNRINIVLTTSDSFFPEEVIVCKSLVELLDQIKTLALNDIFVIGGEKIYSQLLPYCNEAYITKIYKKYTADKYLPNLDEDLNWKCVFESDYEYYNDICFYFVKYEKRIYDLNDCMGNWYNYLNKIGRTTSLKISPLNEDLCCECDFEDECWERTDKELRIFGSRLPQPAGSIRWGIPDNG